MRKWRKNFLILSLYPPSLSISYIKICHILSQMSQKNSTYALQGNNSRSNSLRGSSVSCAGLVISRPRDGELWFLSPFLFEPSQAEIETSPLLEKKIQDRNWDRDLYSSQIQLSLGTQVLTSGKSIDRQIKGALLRTTIYKT